MVIGTSDALGKNVILATAVRWFGSDTSLVIRGDLELPTRVAVRSQRLYERVVDGLLAVDVQAIQLLAYRRATDGLFSFQVQTMRLLDIDRRYTGDRFNFAF